MRVCPINKQNIVASQCLLESASTYANKEIVHGLKKLRTTDLDQ